MAEPETEADVFARAVIGAAITVHRELGPGFLESVYEEALSIELARCRIPFTRQPSVEVRYQGQIVEMARLDLLVGGCLVVELKAVENILPIHGSQVVSYLRATHNHLGLLLNFNVPAMRMGIKRIILSR